MYLNLIPQYKADLEQFVLKEGYFTRSGKLDLTHTVGHLLHMSANRNKDGYEITSQNYFSELSAHLEERFPLPKASRSSFCEARQKISWKAFEFLLTKLRYDENELTNRFLWFGHRVFAIDGTKLLLPHSDPIIKVYPQRKAGGKKPGLTGLCHYPQGLLVSICNVFTGQPLAACFGNKHFSEKEGTKDLLKTVQKGDVVLLDRGLGDRQLWIECDESGVYYVNRIKANEDKNGKWLGEISKFLKSGKKEAFVQIEKKDEKRPELTKVSIIRLIRGRKTKDGSVLVIGTNLLDKKRYKTKDLLSLYSQRWSVETMYYRVKKLLRIEKFHSRKPEGILQEIFSNLVVLALMAKLSIRSLAEMPDQKKSSFSPNMKNVLEVFRRFIFFWISPKTTPKFHIKRIIGLICFQVSSIICKKQPGRSNHRYSRQPVNRWSFAKSDKIRLSKLGRRPDAPKEIRQKHKRMDQEQTIKCA